ncbi:MAG: hypothetical protein ACF8PN_04860 [Phycisphaerales bacterium]
MTAVLNWVKRNWLIVTLCAVMLIALPTFFFVSEMMNSSARESITNRVQKQDRDLKSVERTTLVIEPLAPDAPRIEEDVTLNEEILEQYRETRERIKSDAENLVNRALEINRHESLLVPGLLPQPTPQQAEVLPFRVHDAYMAAHEEMLDELDAGTPEEVVEVQQRLVDYDRNYRRTQLNVEPDMSLTDEEQKKLDEAMTKQRLALYRQRAADLGVYADLDVFGLDFWSPESGKPKADEMYDWQHTTWLHADIVDAVAGVNGGSDGILDNPVKRIVEINRGTLTGDKAGRRSRGGRDDNSIQVYSPRGGEGGEGGEGFVGRGEGFAGRGGGGGGEYVGYNPEPEKPEEVPNSDPTQPFTYDYAKSMTGRDRSGLYDVRTVEMKLVVDSRRLQEVLDAFSRQNFMTVTGVNIAQVQLLSDLAQGYYYGPDPVVLATISLETLWLREWTTPLMPDEVKKTLGVPVDEDDANKEDN